MNQGSAAPSVAAPILAVDGVSVAFGGVQALHGVALEVGPGEIVGIIGPNGAGKTTLFDCISGHLACSGRVWLDGREVSGLGPHRRARYGLGRSYQDARLYPSLTVWDTLRTASTIRMSEAGGWARVLGSPAARRMETLAADRANEVIELMGLTGYASKFIRELSTGTRRMVDLGCLVVQAPRVILFDEPSSGIAQREAEALGPLLLTIRGHTGASLVVIEHDMPLLLGIADRLYALETGQVIAYGDPAGVVRHPEVVRSYLGDDEVAIRRSGTGIAPYRTPVGT